MQWQEADCQVGLTCHIITLAFLRLKAFMISRFHWWAWNHAEGPRWTWIWILKFHTSQTWKLFLTSPNLAPGSYPSHNCHSKGHETPLLLCGQRAWSVGYGFSKPILFREQDDCSPYRQYICCWWWATLGHLSISFLIKPFWTESLLIY